MLEILRRRGFDVEPELDGAILGLLRRTIAFDYDELVGIIEDMYAQPERKPQLLEILQNNAAEEAVLQRDEPDEYAARQVEAQAAWEKVVAHFGGE